MKPTGTKQPLVYILGEAPGAEEDKEGEQFIGKSGQLLRGLIPKNFDSLIRWNNVVRTRPVNNATPERTEIECCRPSVARDIEAAQPRAIFGFGNIPLSWAMGQSGIAKWRGRKLPVQIGNHVCWFFPFSHPAHLLRMRRVNKWNGKVIKSELERTFKFDLLRAFDLVEELKEPRVWTAAEAEADVEVIECSEAGLKRLEELIVWACKQHSAGFDYENYPLRPYAKDAIILSAAIGTEKRSFSFPVDHPKARWSKAQRKHVLEMLEAFLYAKTIKFVHNLKHEMEWSAFTFGKKILRASQWEDTYNQAATLDERFGDTKPGCLSLEFLVLQHFGLNLKNLSPLDRKDLRKEPLRDVLRYNGMDAKFHHMLGLSQMEDLRAVGLQQNYEADLRKIPTIALTQIVGIEVHQPTNEQLRQKYQAVVDKAQQVIQERPEVQKYQRLFKEEFNPGSNKQMGTFLLKVLHSKEGLQDDGSYDVDEAVLLRIDHPIIPKIIELRKKQKLLSTYLLPYSQDKDKGTVWPDGRIHPTINQPGTVSNRTSADSPNIQNPPKRNEEAREIQKQFKAPKGHMYASFDHGQIQFRGIGMASKDKNLVKYLWDRHDIHGEWAERLSRAYPSVVGGKQNFTDKKIMKAFRHTAKNQWVFPLCFGSDVRARSEQVKIPENILKPQFGKFFEMFPGIKEWHERLQKHYNQTGEVVHLDGRINRAPLSFNQMINYPIQGVEAQIVMDGYCRVSERADAEDDWYYQPSWEVHDDLKFILPEKGIDGYVENIVTDMLSTDFDFINVPLTVEVALGKDLYTMDEVLAASTDDWFGKGRAI